MLEVPTQLRTDLESFDILTNVLVKIEFTTPILITDSAIDITYNGETYISGPIRSVSPPRAEGQINRDIFEVAIDDPDYTTEQRLITETSGVNVSIYLKIGDNFLPVYLGKTSNFTSTVTEGESGIENLVTISCTGPLAKLYQVSNRTTTEASQKSLYEFDSAFDFSFDSENEATIKWGGT